MSDVARSDLDGENFYIPDENKNLECFDDISIYTV